MQETIQEGAIFIREGTKMPTALNCESESYSPGWRSVQGMGGYALERKIQDAGWHFFYLAGGGEVKVLGREGRQTIGNAIKHILAGLKSEKVNSFEITRMTFKTFMGVHYATVGFHTRNIQESMLLQGLA